MKNYTLLILFTFLLLLSCQSNAIDLAHVSVDDLEFLVKDLKETEGLDKDKISNLLLHIDSFVVQKPQDASAPKYLELKAKYLTALGKNQKSLKVYNRIYTDYKNYENHSDALFMIAFIYENNLNDKDRAKRFFEKYLVEFPEGVFAKDAKFSIENMNKTPEELMKMLEKMNEEAETTAQ